MRPVNIFYSKSTSSEINRSIEKLEILLTVNHDNEKIDKITRKIIELTAANGNLWREFRNWVKPKVSKEVLNRSDVHKVAHAVRESGILTIESLRILKENLQATNQVNSGRMPLITQDVVSGEIQQVTQILKEFDPTFLQEAFSKNHRRLGKILNFIAAYKLLAETVDHQQKMFLEELQIRLKIWILQYLAKGSKIPLLEQRGPIHLPFTEYHASNINEYYRHDGGAISELLAGFLKQKCDFSSKENYVFEVIKEDCFPPICKAACKLQNIEYSTIEVGTESHFELINSLTDKTYYDATSLLQNKYRTDSGRGVSELIEDFSRLALQADKSLLFGGVVKIDEQDCYIIFPMPAANELVKQIRNFRGSLGAFPEISKIRSQLVEAQFPLEDAIKYSPLPLQPLKASIQDISGTLEEVLKVFGRMITNLPKHSQTLIASHYIDMFSYLLTSLRQLVQQNPDLHSSTCLGPLVKSTLNIEKRIANMVQIDSIKQMHPGRKIQEILQDVNLAIEEFLFILCFVDLPTRSESRSFIQTIQSLFPTSDYKQSFACSSGMASFWHVVEGLKEIYPNPLQIGFLEGSYYELTSDVDFGGYIGRFAEYQMQNAEKMIDSSISFDVICMDIYPNYVLLEYVKTNPLIQIISKHLEIHVDSPLTIIIDTSTTMFWNTNIQNVLEIFSNQIKEGKLNLVVITSLAKFSMCGLDKYTGGVIQTYNNFPKDSPNQVFNQLLDRATKKDSLSQEAEKFFYSFMHNASVVDNYLRVINQNTQMMYERLENLQDADSPIQLGKRDEGIPLLGFFFEKIIITLYKKPTKFKEHLLNIERQSNLVFFMQYFLAAKAMQKDLPISVKNSFGFPSANFTECGTALRMSVGLEDENTISEFAHLIEDERDALVKDLVSLKDNRDLMRNVCYLLDKRGDTLKEWIAEHKVALIDFSKHHSFIEVMKFIYEQVNPEKMIHAILNLPENNNFRDWIVSNKNELIFFSKNNPSLVSMKEFTITKLIPLKKILDEVNLRSTNNTFKVWFNSQTTIWINFITDHPLDELQSFAGRAYYLYCFSISIKEQLDDGTFNFKFWFEKFEDESINYAKTHSFEDFRNYLQKMGDIMDLFSRIDENIEKDMLSISSGELDDIRENVIKYVEHHSIEEINVYMRETYPIFKQEVRVNHWIGLPEGVFLS